VPLALKGTVKEMKGRKVIVTVTVSAMGTVCAKGEVIAVKMPEQMNPMKKEGRE
jgi:hypothetical protein